jgi:hypothetical protein
MVRSGSNEYMDIGLDRKFETMVFQVEGLGQHGEGNVTDWASEIECRGYNDHDAAQFGHYAMCFKYDRISRSDGLNAQEEA